MVLKVQELGGAEVKRTRALAAPNTYELIYVDSLLNYNTSSVLTLKCHNAVNSRKAKKKKEPSVI